MASTGKRKTTMAKLQRERRLLERRIEKKAKKDARKRAAAEPRASPAVLPDRARPGPLAPERPLELAGPLPHAAQQLADVREGGPQLRVAHSAGSIES